MSEPGFQEIGYSPEDINSINISFVRQLGRILKDYRDIRHLINKSRYSEGSNASRVLLTRDWEYVFTRPSIPYLELIIIKRPIGEATSLVEEELDITIGNTKIKPLLKHDEAWMGKLKQPPEVNNRAAEEAGVRFLNELEEQTSVRKNTES